MTSTEIVDRQLFAYNNHDATAFADSYTDPVDIVDRSGATTRLDREGLIARYAPLFLKHPAVVAEIVNRISLGEWVIDHERLTGLTDAEEVQAIAVYRVTDGLISEVRFLEA